jgi:opacity protein-like surface antigen
LARSELSLTRAGTRLRIIWREVDVMRIVALLVLALAWPAAVHGQSAPPQASRDVFAAISWGRVFRVEDRNFGDRPTIGAGLRLPLNRRLGMEFEVNRVLGLKPDQRPCGVAGGCVGSAREGVSSATLASADIFFRFPRGTRAEAFAAGGVGGLWIRSIDNLTTIRDGIGHVSEFQKNDGGLTINAGGGVDIALTQRVLLRPQIRIYGSGPMSTHNMNVIRGGIDVGYRW